MKLSWYPFLLLLLIILFDPFMKVSLILASVIALAFVIKPSQAFAWAFVYGLIYDLRLLNCLGGTSLMLVVLVFIIDVVKQKLKQFQWVYVVLFGVVGGVLWQWQMQPPIELGTVVLQALLTLGIWWILARVTTKEGVYLKG